MWNGTRGRQPPSPSGSTRQRRPEGWDIGVATLGQEGSDSLLLRGDYLEGHPAVSPDGRWLAYYSYEGGGSYPQVFVRPLPLYGPGRKHQVSRAGGNRPRWSEDGTELFYAGDPRGGSTRGLFVATLDRTGGDVDVVDIEMLFEMAGDGNYDVFPGDSLFAVLQPVGGQEALPDEATVVLNFDRVLREIAVAEER